MSDSTRRNFPHYHKDVSHLSYVDVYRVLSLFNVTNPAIAHAIKKLLVAGKRGAKDLEKDWREAVVSINRALQMLSEDNTQRTGEAPPPVAQQLTWLIRYRLNDDDQVAGEFTVVAPDEKEAHLKAAMDLSAQFPEVRKFHTDALQLPRLFQRQED